MNSKLAVYLAIGMVTAAAGDSSAASTVGMPTANSRYAIATLSVCSATESKAAASIILDVGTNTNQTEIPLVKQSRCKAKEDSYLTFYSTGKVDKAAILFVSTNSATACKDPELGRSPADDGTQVFEAKIQNGFVQPIEIKVGNVANGEYYYCVDMGVEPMPNPAIIIKE